MQQLANEKQHSQFPVHIHIVAQHYIVTQLEYKLFQTGGTELTKCFQNFAVLNMQCFSFFLQKLILHLNLLFIHVLKRKLQKRRKSPKEVKMGVAGTLWQRWIGSSLLQL